MAGGGKGISFLWALKRIGDSPVLGYIPVIQFPSFGNERLTMSCLASSPILSSPKIRVRKPFAPNPTFTIIKSLQSPDPVTSPSHNTTHHHQNSGLISRREVVGCGGLSVGLLLQPRHAAAAETGGCELTVAPSGLAFCDKTVGDGPQPTKGQLIKAHYVGKLENGKVFDSSYSRGKPLTFRIGVGEVIKGWDEGILGGQGVPPMLPGGKRTLKLPPALGYGVRGAGCKGGSCIIPPDSVLLFDVEYIGKG